MSPSNVILALNLKDLDLMRKTYINHFPWGRRKVHTHLRGNKIRKKGRMHGRWLKLHIPVEIINCML